MANSNMIRGYKTELDPNNKQITLFKKACGVARYVYNWGLDKKQESYKLTKKSPSAYELSKELNKIKKSDFPWMKEVSKCCYQIPLKNLDKAFQNFFRNCKKKSKIKKGYPVKKSKKKGLGSFTLDNNIYVYDNSIQLPRIGIVRLKETNYIPIDKKILKATISEKAGHWFVSVQIKEPDIKHNLEKTGEVVGVDLGLNKLATCSDGTIYDNPKPLKENLKKLKRLQKRLSRKKKGGTNRAKARIKLARLHYKISCIRKDTLHKITTFLTKTKSRIVIENLSVSNMMKNHCLARAISDVGWYEFKRQLEYKGKLYNCEIVIVDKFYPSSKLCSNCGNKKDNLKLSDRVYKCDKCGLEIDRDLNAAINLENYDITNTGSSSGINACGEIGQYSNSKKLEQTVSGKQELNMALKNGQIQK